MQDDTHARPRRMMIVVVSLDIVGFARRPPQTFRHSFLMFSLSTNPRMPKNLRRPARETPQPLIPHLSYFCILPFFVFGRVAGIASRVQGLQRDTLTQLPCSLIGYFDINYCSENGFLPITDEKNKPCDAGILTLCLLRRLNGA